MGLKRVVVTGLGTINPIGKTVGEFFSNLDNGLSGAALITDFDTSHFKTRFACIVKDFNPAEYGIERKELRRIDRFAQFAIVAADQAIADCGIDLQNTDLERIGVILGSGIGGVISLTDEIVDYCDGGKLPRFSPFLITKMISDMAPGLISIRHGLAGPNYTTTSACASASHAMADALNLIRMGKVDMMLTGGAEAPISIPSIAGFNSAKALSTNNDEFETASRPFDLTRDGFVMGEGSAVLVFEELEHALARGAKIYAEVAGAGISADAYHITAPHPGGKGAAKAMELALKDAGMQPEDIDYINVHGTSTPLGDVAELKGVNSVFGDHAYKLNISSTKSMHGHLLGAAGAVEALACIHAINASIIPPTINFRFEDPEIDYKLNLTLNQSQQRTVRAAMNNAFGFGGHNSSIIFKSM